MNVKKYKKPLIVRYPWTAKPVGAVVQTYVGRGRCSLYPGDAVSVMPRPVLTGNRGVSHVSGFTGIRSIDVDGMKVFHRFYLFPEEVTIVLENGTQYSGEEYLELLHFHSAEQW